MLRHTLRIWFARAIVQRTSVESPFRSRHELSKSPELQAQAVARGTRPLYVLVLTLVASLSPVPSRGADGDNSALPTARLFVEVRLDAPRKLSGLKPGSSLEGAVERDVYSGDRRLIPAGSRVHLTVDSVKRRRRVRNRYRPWLAQLFASRHENFPAFRSGSFSLPDGSEISVRVSLVAAIHPVEVSAQSNAAAQAREANPILRNRTEEKKDAKQQISRAGPRLILEADRPASGGLAATASEGTSEANGANSHGQAHPPMPATLAGGAPARLILLTPVSASKNHPGDSFYAQLLEPARLSSGTTLPEGTIIEGRVARRVPPRWLSRPGSLNVTFTGLTLPSGVRSGIAASLVEAEVEKGSQMRMDSEGGLRGGNPGIAHVLIDLGVTAGIAKVTDDSFQLVAETLLSTATDASTAGSARLAAVALSGLYLISRHGRDVILPKYTEMDMRFDQPRSVP